MSGNKTLPLPTLVLASASPRRHALLSSLGLTFQVQPADIDETAVPNEQPMTLVTRLSQAKAEAVARYHPEAFVIAADTVVVFADKVLGKPHTLKENRAFLTELAGHTHDVYTGYALAYKGQIRSSYKRSGVQFRALTQAEIARYVASGEGMDKAGGYGIQGLGATLVSSVSGCYFNVVGLSLSHLVTQASLLGVHLV